MLYICKQENTENTNPMDFKKIACTVVRRWNEKRMAGRAKDVPRDATPQAVTTVATAKTDAAKTGTTTPRPTSVPQHTPNVLRTAEAKAVQSETPSPKAANLESALGGFLAERYEFRHLGLDRRAQPFERLLRVLRHDRFEAVAAQRFGAACEPCRPVRRIVSFRLCRLVRLHRVLLCMCRRVKLPFVLSAASASRPPDFPRPASPRECRARRCSLRR